MNDIKQDIQLAKDWCASSKVLESPGKGEGWRHTCYRLAMEVERLERERDQWQHVAEGLAASLHRVNAAYLNEAVSQLDEATTMGELDSLFYDGCKARGFAVKSLVEFNKLKGTK